MMVRIPRNGPPTHPGEMLLEELTHSSSAKEIKKIKRLPALAHVQIQNLLDPALLNQEEIGKAILTISGLRSPILHST